MEQERAGFSSEKQADNDNRKRRTAEPVSPVEQAQPKPETLGQRWRAVRLTTATLLWACLATFLLTMLLGFTWGGWVRGSTAQQAADVMARDAVVQRLATICVNQFQMDAAKVQKLQELQATASYQRGTFVRDQGWAIMPGDEQPDNRVSEVCAAQLMQITQ